jgi:hypothetical protein
VAYRERGCWLCSCSSVMILNGELNHHVMKVYGNSGDQVPSIQYDAGVNLNTLLAFQVGR